VFQCVNICVDTSVIMCEDVRRCKCISVWRCASVQVYALVAAGSQWGLHERNRSEVRSSSAQNSRCEVDTQTATHLRPQCYLKNQSGRRPWRSCWAPIALKETSYVSSCDQRDHTALPLRSHIDHRDLIVATNGDLIGLIKHPHNIYSFTTITNIYSVNQQSSYKQTFSIIGCVSLTLNLG